MIKIAVTEDDTRQQQVLKEYLARYSKESSQPFHVEYFNDGLKLLENYIPGKFDLLILDIQMRHMDGMETAQKIRTTDEAVIIIFITNFTHYAIQGYSVRAFDFIIKPIEYELFAVKIKDAIGMLKRNRRGKVYFKVQGGQVELDRMSIMYFEIFARKIIIHTDSGSYQTNDTLKSIEQALDDTHFFRCHTSFLVNTSHVSFVGKNFAMVGGVEIPISKHRRKNFLDTIANHLSEERGYDALPNSNV